MDFTLADHFLISVSLPGCDVQQDERASPRLPRQWSDMKLWQKGLEHASPVMAVFSSLLEQSVSVFQEHRSVQRATGAQWLADAAAFTLSVITGCVRDGWCCYPSHQGKNLRSALVRTTPTLRIQ